MKNILIIFDILTFITNNIRTMVISEHAAEVHTECRRWSSVDDVGCRARRCAGRDGARFFSAV